MASYESVIGILETELTGVADVFAGLAPDQWRRSTLLVSVDPDLPKRRRAGPPPTTTACRSSADPYRARVWGSWPTGPARQDRVTCATVRPARGLAVEAMLDLPDPASDTSELPWIAASS